MVRSSLCSSQASEDSTEVILEDEIQEFAEYNEDQICGMSSRIDEEGMMDRYDGHESTVEERLKPFEDFEGDEEEEDDSIDKDVTIDEYIEDDFRKGFTVYISPSRPI